MDVYEAVTSRRAVRVMVLRARSRAAGYGFRFFQRRMAELNRGLETRVAEQVEELGRVGRLKRFLAPLTA